jgi:hypothetical protein
MSNCPNCGSDLAMRVSGLSITTYCNKCDWSVTTSLLWLLEKDKKKYTFTFQKEIYDNIEEIKKIAPFIKLSVIEIYKYFKTNNKLNIEFNAIDSKRIGDLMKKNKVSFSIDPHFEWFET